MKSPDQHPANVRQEQKGFTILSLCRALFYVCAFVVLSPTQAIYGRVPEAQETPQPQRLDEPWIALAGLDTSDFPLVRSRLWTADTQSSPVGDLSFLVVRENGVPVPEFTADEVRVGVDLVFVIDANDMLQQVDDDSGLTRLEKVQQSIDRFANSYMDPTGLDRVSILAPGPDNQGMQWIVRDAAQPAALAAAADGYATTTAGQVLRSNTPLNEMLLGALAHLGENEAGRFRAIWLLTDGARLDQQLDYAALTTQTLTEQVPIFVAILGARADENEVANVTRLIEPTRGRYLHMPQAEAADPFYQLWQQQGRQIQIEYTSLQRQSGPVELSVQLGNVRDALAFDVTLAAPDVTFEGLNERIRRVGASPDALLPLLQPAAQPFTAVVNWPDGRPRQLSRLDFRVNDQSQPVNLEASGGAAGMVGRYPLVWDISELDAGTYRLQLFIEDELGYQATSPVVEVEILVSRPEVPTPTAAPTSTPLLPVAGGLAATPWFWLLPIAGIGLLGLLLFFVYRSRRKTVASGEVSEVGEVGDGTEEAAAFPLATARPSTQAQIAYIERLDAGGMPTGEQFLITQSSLPGLTTFYNVTIGRDLAAVDYVLDDAGISRLHARIHGSTAEGYWLHDEGSAGGTYLNFERLGLAPRRLEHGDVVQFGRLMFRFVLTS